MAIASTFYIFYQFWVPVPHQAIMSIVVTLYDAQW